MVSSAWDERYAGSELVWSATPNGWVEQATTDLPPGRVLDLAGRRSTQRIVAGRSRLGGHRRRLSGANVEADLAGTGQVIERNETVLRTVNTQDGPRQAVDALPLAVRNPTTRAPTEETHR